MALGTALAVLLWLLGVWPPPVWWRDHWPRETAMMRAAGGRASVHPTPLRDISPRLQRMVIIGEDSRFWTHHGIDPAELADALGISHRRGIWTSLRTAWERRDHIRGASTITQQLAKNLYLSSTRSVLRKVKEAVTALRLELALPKQRILELYLGVAEWGPGVWGADAASRTYFRVAPSQLSETQAAALAATLPHPRSSNPAFQPERTMARRDLILARYRGAAVEVPPEPAEADTASAADQITLPALDSLEGLGEPGGNDRITDSLPTGRGDTLGIQGDTAAASDTAPADSVTDSLP
ncbi:MAG TPA: biosynthetic peptidoglycan transglycosylase [Gemmatimonadales bacterium]|nr:biosynthetic peptidoglycan transglycosylase [Gemmatimonadales bacterium]